MVEHPVLHRSAAPAPGPRYLEIIDVRDRTSTALIMSGQREFAVGAPVELRHPVNGDQTASGLTQADLTAYRKQLLPCLEAAYQAIRAAEAAGVSPPNSPQRNRHFSMPRRHWNAPKPCSIRAMPSRPWLRLAEADCMTAPRAPVPRHVCLPRAACQHSLINTVCCVATRSGVFPENRRSTVIPLCGQSSIKRISNRFPILIVFSRNSCWPFRVTSLGRNHPRHTTRSDTWSLASGRWARCLHP